MSVPRSTKGSVRRRCFKWTALSVGVLVMGALGAGLVSSVSTARNAARAAQTL